MVNPLFAPPPTEPPTAYRWVDPVEAAFSVMVPGGWSAEGGLLKSGANLKYMVFDLRSPEGAIVFWGHPDLPQRYVVPAPWHAGLGMQPGKRGWFGSGDQAQELFGEPYIPAQRLWSHLVNKRFGICIPGVVEVDTELTAFVRSSAAQSGSVPRRLDACRATFASADGAKCGRIWLATFGGDQPGETWSADFITGYFGPKSLQVAMEAAYQQARKSLSTDRKWLTPANNDIDKARRTAHDTVGNLGRIDAADQAREVAARKELDGIRKGVVDVMKQRH